MRVMMTVRMKGANPDAKALRALLAQEFEFRDPRIDEVAKHRDSLLRYASPRYDKLINEAGGRLNAAWKRQEAHYVGGRVWLHDKSREVKWGELKKWLRSVGIPFDLKYEPDGKPNVQIDFRDDNDAFHLKMRWF